jgi:adenine-specific DNA-methyltransferase
MKLYETLEQQLKKEPTFVTDNGELKKWVVLNKAQNFDKELIGLLLDNAELKDEFFVSVKGTLVFKQNLFVQFLEQKNYMNDSYTKYKNKVGLTIDGKYLKQRNEVALVWPFKDCLLEGGQSHEEDKREEIFFNEILAQDEITQLLEPKVLTNAKRIDKDGEKLLDQFNRNENGTITDNLIIKGNNLLALHSLKKEFSGKVKLIYIDPPYNTGNDGFNYNDNFNHSTWLTFMKNRLEVARKLLRDDGVIFVQCDYNEVHYLKILMDSLFGKENFINEIIWKRKFGNANETKRLGTAYDNILIFAKSSNYSINLIKEKSTKHVQDYIKSRFTRKDEKGKHKGKLWMPYPLANPGKPTKNLIYEYKGYNSPIKGWRMTKEKLIELDNDERLYFPEDKSQRIQEKKFLEEYDGQPVDSLWTDIFVINSQSGEAFDFDGQKPEDLLKRIILIATNEGDIVLDYHLGSATTAAVAHKMDRQYIGIEQMDYIEPIAVERLKKVIDGEQGGISKSVNWQGGGSFVYLELKKYDEIFIEQIEGAKDTEALLQIWEQMKAKSFFKYSVDLKAFQNNIEEFKQFDIKKQKGILCELLDKNQLYANLSSLNDTDFECTNEEKKVTKDFYQIKN